MQIVNLNTPEEVARSFAVFCELRPSLTEEQSFVEQVIAQQKEGYRIAAICLGDEVLACSGFRLMNMLAWGKVLYIDDLITKDGHRGKGYGKALLDYTTQVARDNGCSQIHLDSGYTRHEAHALYLSYGFKLRCHHLALDLQ